MTLKSVWGVLKQSFSGFAADKVPKLSASLAYYTVFSLGPLLIVIIFLVSFLYGREAIEGTIVNQMKDFVGEDAAAQIQTIIAKSSLAGKSTFSAIIGVIALLVGATTVFGEIQDSINTIWGVKAKPKSGIWKLVKDRLLSFGIIGSLGFLLLVSLAITAVVEGLSARLANVFPQITVILFYIINLLITLAVVTTLFGVIFRVLPDARIKWRDVLAGAITTALLFMLGKFLIALYVSKSSLDSTYGAAGSFVVLLVWIYYSSFILYFGAEFTKAWAVKFGSEIHPTEYAVLIKRVEVESDAGSLQQNEAEMEQHKEDLKQGRTPQLVSHSNGAQRHQKRRHGNVESDRPERAQHNVVKVKPYKLDDRDYDTVRKATKKSVGLGTVAAGLLLYMVNTHRKK